jgi:hypothetical protein
LLNALRNDLAHKLDTPTIDADIDELINSVDSWLKLRLTGRFSRLDRLGQLREALHSLCKGLAGVCAVVRDDGEKQRKLWDRQIRTTNAVKSKQPMPPNPSLHPTVYSGLRPLPSAGELKR